MAIRNDKGQFVPKEAVEPAIFASVGKGTCGFRNLTLTMQAGEIYREKGKRNIKGKRIEFGPNGKYETKDTEEINFLKWKEKNPNPFSKIKCVQEPAYKEEDKDDKDGKK